MGARELWQQVLVQAVHDALSPNKVTKAARNGGMITELDRRLAAGWIAKGGRDFRLVCSLAGLDPDFVRDAFNAGRIDHDRLISGIGSRRHMTPDQYKAARAAQVRIAQARRRIA